MVDVHDVANWFLSKSSMTHKKLQKLCYYAQAWYCALYDGSPLFEDVIEAWAHGPVIPVLYPKYADYRWNPIPQLNDIELNLEDKVTDVLDAVYRTYAKFDGDQLERLTHSENPWIEARGDLKLWEPCSVAISCKSMREYYGRKYSDAQREAQND